MMLPFFGLKHMHTVSSLHCAFNVEWQALQLVPGFQGAGEPLVMSVKGNQVGGNFLRKQRFNNIHTLPVSII